MMYRFGTTPCYKCGRTLSYYPPVSRYRMVPDQEKYGPLCSSCITRGNPVYNRDGVGRPSYTANGMPYVNPDSLVFANPLHQGACIDPPYVPQGTYRGPTIQLVRPDEG